MLSPDELDRTRYELGNIAPGITGRKRQNIRRQLKEKLLEHEYASQYPPFSPPPHEHVFVNRLTTNTVLERLIEAARNTNTFTMDTESVGLHGQLNRPALVQLQILSDQEPSTVAIVECLHLPLTNSRTFELTRRLFSIAFHEGNTIYTWGTIEEAKPFVKFGLFTRDQLHAPEHLNLQRLFKAFWNGQHAHRPAQSSPSGENDRCTCELCLGKDPENPYCWSLQDATAQQLREWLDKRQSRSAFDTGLDPR